MHKIKNSVEIEQYTEYLEITQYSYNNVETTQNKYTKNWHEGMLHRAFVKSKLMQDDENYLFKLFSSFKT